LRLGSFCFCQAYQKALASMAEVVHHVRGVSPNRVVKVLQPSPLSNRRSPNNYGLGEATAEPVGGTKQLSPAGASGGAKFFGDDLQQAPLVSRRSVTLKFGERVSNLLEARSDMATPLDLLSQQRHETQLAEVKDVQAKITSLMSIVKGRKQKCAEDKLSAVVQEGMGSQPLSGYRSKAGERSPLPQPSSLIQPSPLPSALKSIQSDAYQERDMRRSSSAMRLSSLQAQMESYATRNVVSPPIRKRENKLVLDELFMGHHSIKGEDINGEDEQEYSAGVDPLASLESSSNSTVVNPEAGRRAMREKRAWMKSSKIDMRSKSSVVLRSHSQRFPAGALDIPASLWLDGELITIVPGRLSFCKRGAKKADLVKENGESLAFLSDTIHQHFLPLGCEVGPMSLDQIYAFCAKVRKFESENWTHHVVLRAGSEVCSPCWL
jgi:hypothetical protein